MSRSPTLRRLAAGLALAAALGLLPAAAAEASPGRPTASEQGLDAPAFVGWLWKAVSWLFGDEARRASGLGSSPRPMPIGVKDGGAMIPDGQPQAVPPAQPQPGGEMGSAG